jgi:hypothetical protein
MFESILIIALIVGLFCSIEIFDNEDNSSE